MVQVPLNTGLWAQLKRLSGPLKQMVNWLILIYKKGEHFKIFKLLSF